MSSLRRLGFVVVVIVAGFAPSQRARGEEPAPVEVRVASGTTLRFRHVLRTDQIVDTGLLPMLSSTVVARDVVLTSKGAAPGGGTRFTWSFERVRGRSSSLLGDSVFDSSAPAADDLIGTSLSALGGVTVTVDVDARGAVTAVGGLDEALAAARKAATGDDALRGMLLTQLLQPERIRQEIEFTLLVTPLPPGAPAKGSTWTDADSIPGTSGVSFTVDAERRVESVDTGVLTIGGTARGGAKADPSGRVSNVAQKMLDAGADAFSVRSTAHVSVADGLPLDHETTFAVVLPQELPDGGEGVIEQRMRATLVRLATDAAPGDDPVATFTLFSPTDPGADVAEVSWLRRRGALQEKSEEPAAAQAEYTAAVAVARAAATRRPNDPALLEEYVRAASSLASLERGAENYAASIALWAEIRARTEALRKAKAGSPWFTWEEAHAGVMQAIDSDLSGDGKAADAVLRETDALLVAATKASPEDTQLLDVHAWMYERWCEVLSGLGDAKSALAKGESGVAVRDRIATLSERTPRQRQALVDGLWELADVALAAGDTTKAGALLERAGRDVEPLIPVHESFAQYKTDIAARRANVAAIAKGAKPADAAQAADMAYLYVRMKRYPDAVSHFEIAFSETSVREDWDRFNLYNAACAAGLAHAAAKPAEKATFAKTAIAWLTPHVAHLKTLAASDDAEERDRAMGNLEWCHTGDSDLESLRALPEFAALFGE